MINLRHLLEMMVNPFFIVIVLFGIFLVLLWNKKYINFSRLGLLFVFVLLLIFSTGWVAYSLITYLENKYVPVTKIDPHIKWVVVLSGGQFDADNYPINNLLSAASIKRLLEGIRLYIALPGSKLLLSGGGLDAQTPEAVRLAQLAAWFKVPSADIVLETKSINTVDQAKEIKAIVQDKSFYLVTSAVHMTRAMLACRRVGLHPIAAPTDYTFFWKNDYKLKMLIPNPGNLGYFTVAWHELLGRLTLYSIP